MTQTNTTQNKEELEEQKIRLILDKTYIDGYKSGKGGLGYSERAYEQLKEIISQAHQSGIEEERKRIEDKIIEEGNCPACTADLYPHRNCILR